MTVPLVSICIPVLNGERHLEAAINSALSQDYPNIEVVIVDNASTDSTEAIVNRYARTHPTTMRVFRNESRLPMTENFNATITRASGEFIKLLPHDDLLFPNSLSTLMHARSTDDQFLVGLRSFLFEGVGWGRRRFYRDQNRYWRADRVFGVGYIAPADYVQTAASNCAHNSLGEPANVIFSRDAFLEAGGFDENHHQLCDLDLWHRLACQHGLRIVAETVACFRVHQDSESASDRRARKTTLLREHVQVSELMEKATARLELQSAHRLASINLALDQARLNGHLGSPYDGAGALNARAAFVCKYTPDKRVLQLSALKLLSKGL